ncbi:MAG: hypothetical protein HRT74_10565, partial [Flavobacteriales bacterium]|nr:hypothetical protein [Flavobacteriales bacterium]
CGGFTVATACNYDATATLDDGSCDFVSCAGCTDPLACNFDSEATIDDGSCQLPDGCTNDTACNYDPSALCDDGSCEFLSCAGCTDSDATNFDPSATIDNSSCQYLTTFYVDMAVAGAMMPAINGDFTSGDASMSALAFDVYTFTISLAAGSYNYNFVNGGVAETLGARTVTVVDAPQDVMIVCFNELVACAGCTDPASVEFNPYAGSDDGSCANAVVLGCTYGDADNFSPSANTDDGSCQFTNIGNNDCPADFNGDSVVNASDLLNFLSQFGSTCD